MLRVERIRWSYENQKPVYWRYLVWPQELLIHEVVKCTELHNITREPFLMYVNWFTDAIINISRVNYIYW